jgi:putative transcriptional regulator
MKKSDFEGLMRGLSEARDFARGKKVAGIKVHVPADIDVAAIRARTGLSQNVFARHIGVSAATLRNWEQNRRRPDGPARVLLALIKKDPHIVRRMLSRAA